MYKEVSIRAPRRGRYGRGVWVVCGGAIHVAGRIVVSRVAVRGVVEASGRHARGGRADGRLTSGDCAAA